MRKLAGVAFLVALAFVALGTLAPSAPDGVLRDLGEAIRSFWGYPVSGP